MGVRDTMIQITPTKNLTGVTIRGDYADFDELIDSIYRITGLEQDKTDRYYGVKIMLLGICYDIRHAKQGDREIHLTDNGMDKDLMVWHKTVTPVQNVYYSVNILFPDAIFTAASFSEMCLWSSVYYGPHAKGYTEDMAAPSYMDFMRDRANLNVLCAGIWQALAEVIGADEAQKIYESRNREYGNYEDYVVHYVDKCNLELIKTPVEKRKTKIRNIAKRIVKKPEGYYSMERNLRYSAQHYGVTIYDLKDPRLEYPDEWEW